MGIYAFILFTQSDSYESIDDTFHYYKSEAIWDILCSLI